MRAFRTEDESRTGLRETEMTLQRNSLRPFFLVLALKRAAAANTCLQ